MLGVLLIALSCITTVGVPTAATAGDRRAQEGDTGAMGAPKPGTVTLLFSDIEGSTRMLTRLGPLWGEALSTQRSLLRSVFREHGGREMGTEGDSFFVVFSSAREAVAAAIEGQRRLHHQAWPGDVRVRVRIGLHTGEPQPHEDGYIGLDVHRAARISATASGGQIVLSEATRALVRDLDEGAGVRDLGWHRLKDLTEPEHLYDVVVAGLPSDFPPPRSLGTRASLPVPATALIGRTREVEDLTTLLTTEEARLVTLTGPGGTGKTSVALAVASALEHAFPHGLYFVPLHAVNRSELMWAAMADAVGAPGDVEHLPWDRTLDFVADRDMLLVLDNLEQIPDADATIDRLLSHARGVRVLATSRRPLHLAAEHEYPLSPLELPSPGVLDHEGAARVPSVALFAARAAMVDPRFTLSEDNLPDVVELCRRLDGLPLAIELAAARSRLLSPHALLHRLDSRLGLGVTAADRSERQRTLGSTIAWSYDLLDPADQRTFRLLGVFRRRCDLRAVEAVVGTDVGDPLDAVVGLADASLVRVRAAPDGEPRISMLQTIRSFARERLDSSGEGDAARLRHARWCTEVASEIEALLRGPTQMSALDRMDDVEEDVRAALDWCLRPEAATDADRTRCGFQLLSAMSLYWYRFGYVAEGRGWHERALRVLGGTDSPEMLDALHYLAVMMLQQGDVTPAVATLERALEMARRIGARDLEARELNSLGVAYRDAGRTAQARRLLEESIALAREIGSSLREATASTNIVALLMDTGAYDEAVAAARRAVELDRARDDPWGLAVNEANLSMALLRAEGPRPAYEHLAKVAPGVVALADTELSICILEAFAATLAELGDVSRAASLVGTADAQRATVGMPRSGPDEAHLERSIGDARTRLTEDAWASAHAAGERRSIDEALKEALGAGVSRAGSRTDRPRPASAAARTARGPAGSRPRG